MMLIVVLVTLFLRIGVPIIIIYGIVKAVKNSYGIDLTKRETWNRSQNQNRSNRQSNTLKNFNTNQNTSRIRPVGGSNFDKRLMTNEELQQSREARNAYLKEKLVDVIEKEEQAEFESTPIIETQSVFNATEMNFNIGSNSELDSVLNSKFDLQLDDRFAPKFDTDFSYNFGKEDVKTNGDENKRSADENFVDSMLREYGVEKKEYEWET